MNNLHAVRLLFLSLAMSLGLSACGAQPYVYDGGEFNRSTPDFGKDQTDISSVTICYSESGATPQDIRVLAINECARFGKTAKFLKQDFLTCPLSTPAAAHFSCESEQPKTGTEYYQY